MLLWMCCGEQFRAAGVQGPARGHWRSCHLHHHFSLCFTPTSLSLVPAVEGQA